MSSIRANPISEVKTGPDEEVSGKCRRSLFLTLRKNYSGNNDNIKFEFSKLSMKYSKCNNQQWIKSNDFMRSRIRLQSQKKNLNLEAENCHEKHESVESEQSIYKKPNNNKTKKLKK